MSAEVEPTERLERLFHAIVPHALQALERHGAFYPFGGTMREADELVVVTPVRGTQRPRSDEWVAALERDVRAQAELRGHPAAALVADVAVPAGEGAPATHAIHLFLEHVGGPALDVFLPYAQDDAGALTVGEPHQQPATARLFPPTVQLGRR